MKLYKTLLASALCAPFVPALAGSVLLDFNDFGNVPSGAAAATACPSPPA